MRTLPLLAAALLAAAGTAAQAAGPDVQYLSPATLGQSVRTREAVVAETRNALASGELKLGGELDTSRPAAPVAAKAPVLSRAEVRAAVIAARNDHTLPRNGEL